MGREAAKPFVEVDTGGVTVRLRKDESGNFRHDSSVGAGAGDPAIIDKAIQIATETEEAAKEDFRSH
ncbi:hypothetical protein HY090_00135 [Candidatus Kaiserbacteria bacterium]|nr:hypothetical protein [Candidatus Kaiserbacteria bacterium]